MRASGVLLAVIAALTAESVLAQAVAPVRAIRAKSIIGPSDLEILDHDAPGAYTDIDDLVGMEARVTLYTGRPIKVDQVGPPALIERNQLVRMNFSRGPLNITTDGRALDRAGIGERVRVMNLTSRQIVSGLVGEDGSIEVGK